MNIDEFKQQLLAIGDRVSACERNLEREQGYINDTVSKTQSNFGNQQPGQQLVCMLTSVNMSICNAGTALYSLRSRVNSYIQQTGK